MKQVFTVVGMALLVFLCGALACAWLLERREPSITIYRDQGTGCDFLLVPNATWPYPRPRADGSHKCEPPLPLPELGCIDYGCAGSDPECAGINPCSP